MVVTLRINHMGRHNGLQQILFDKLLERLNIVAENSFLTAIVIRRFQMRISNHMTMPRKVFPRCGHAGLVHTANKIAGQIHRTFYFATKTAIADGFTLMPKIQHRREAQIDIKCGHFRCHLPAGFQCHFLLCNRIFNQCGKRLHCGKLGETITKTLYSATFLIHRNQQGLFHLLSHRLNQRL